MSVIAFAPAGRRSPAAPLRLSAAERRIILKFRWLEKYDRREVDSMLMCLDAALTGGGRRPLPQFEAENLPAVSGSGDYPEGGA